MDLTYEMIWEKLNDNVKKEVSDFTSKFTYWDNFSVIRNRVLWAVFNFGGRFPWRSYNHTSVNPPFSNICSILKVDKDMSPEELFEFRVLNISQFTGIEERFVAKVLAHTVIYDLYATVLFKYNLSPEKVTSEKNLECFRNHVQHFINEFTTRCQKLE